MICPNCGKEIRDGVKFCPGCGTPVNEAPRPRQEAAQQPVYQPQPVPQNIYIQPAQIPEEYRPVSAWGFFGYQLLFAIPIVGFIFLLVFSLGGTKNICLKNFARSHFCLLIIAIIIFAIIAATGGLGTLMDSISFVIR